MLSCSDDVRHMTEENSARIRRGRRAVRREPLRTNLQPLLQGNPPQPPVEPTYESIPLASPNEIIRRRDSLRPPDGVLDLHPTIVAVDDYDDDGEEPIYPYGKHK
ncbi:unnamed protein product [Protopolystoma xenopodis]|uniref:Uncharacterized protein n=1 Tax=Protopolystoma xenopodis TaxID=117903 RepID=A0A448WBR8_9PLAT|nr:unnamed protein product [Protopolystoma xenopodis]